MCNYFSVTVRQKTYLQKTDGEMWMDFSGDPDSEILVDSLSFRQDVQQFIHEIQAQVTVLEQCPATLNIIIIILIIKSHI